MPTSRTKVVSPNPLLKHSAAAFCGGHERQHLAATMPFVESASLLWDHVEVASGSFLYPSALTLQNFPSTSMAQLMEKELRPSRDAKGDGPGHPTFYHGVNYLFNLALYSLVAAFFPSGVGRYVQLRFFLQTDVLLMFAASSRWAQAPRFRQGALLASITHQ